MKVTVCIATFNGEKYIRQQLGSILSQLSTADDVIISDNCSTDSTIEIIKSFNDSRVSIVTSINLGVVANFENSLNYANGDVIVLSDQDDVWLLGKIDRIKQELESNDLVVTDCMVVDDELNIIHHSLFGLAKPRSGVLANLISNSFTGCCMAFNRKILDAVLPFPADLPMHDWWIGLVGEVIGSVKFIEEPFLLYRRHETNASTLSVSSTYGLRKKFLMRLVLLRSLFFRFIL